MYKFLALARKVRNRIRRKLVPAKILDHHSNLSERSFLTDSPEPAGGLGGRGGGAAGPPPGFSGLAATPPPHPPSLPQHQLLESLQVRERIHTFCRSRGEVGFWMPECNGNVGQNTTIAEPPYFGGSAILITVYHYLLNSRINFLLLF